MESKQGMSMKVRGKVDAPDANSSFNGSSLEIFCLGKEINIFSSTVFKYFNNHYFTTGMGLFLGGCVTSWNKGYECGFATFCIAWFMIALLYFFLVFCMAEMTSIVAFAGGSYGFVRCSISPFLGFLIGCSEWVTNNFMVMNCVMSMGQTITYSFQTHMNWEPLWFFLFYIAVICWHLKGGRYFWYTMCFGGIATFIIILLFVIASLTMDTSFFTKSSMTSSDAGFSKNAYGVFRMLIYPMWAFIGIETVTIAGAKISNVIIIIPFNIDYIS
jgi:ethanolamine permease